MCKQPCRSEKETSWAGTGPGNAEAKVFVAVRDGNAVECSGASGEGEGKGLGEQTEEVGLAGFHRRKLR